MRRKAEALIKIPEKENSAHDFMEQYILEVSSVSKTFAHRQKTSFFHKEVTRVQAIDGVSFSIEKGAMVGLIGANGAGKSTMLRMLSGLLKPDCGTIRVGNFTPGKNRKNFVRQIGALFADLQKISWGVSVYDMLAWNCRCYGIDQFVMKKRINYFVELLEIESALFQRSMQLSLGEQMKVSLMLTFLHNPSVVFLDEPTIGVDITAKESIRRFLMQMNKTNDLTMILTSHDAGDIDLLCDRLLVLERGRLVKDWRKGRENGL